MSLREPVEQAERQRKAATKQKNSAALAEGVWFVAARKLPLGDLTMVANSAHLYGAFECPLLWFIYPTLD